MNDEFDSVDYVNENMTLILELAREAKILHDYLDAVGVDDTDKHGEELSLLSRVIKYNYQIIPTA